MSLPLGLSLTGIGLVILAVIKFFWSLNSDVKAIKDNHLPHIETAVNTQGQATVKELQELRADFRTYFHKP